MISSCVVAPRPTSSSPTLRLPLASKPLGNLTNAHYPLAPTIATQEYHAQQTLKAAAVIGTTFRLNVLSKLLGARLRKTLPTTLAELGQADFLNVGSGGCQFTFTHDLLRQSIYSLCTREQLEKDHLKIATFLEKSARSGDHFPEVALHYLLAGAHEPCLKALLNSIRAAIRNGSASQVIDYVDQIREFVETWEDMQKVADVLEAGILHINASHDAGAASFLAVTDKASNARRHSVSHHSNPHEHYGGLQRARSTAVNIHLGVSNTSLIRARKNSIVDRGGRPRHLLILEAVLDGVKQEQRRMLPAEAKDGEDAEGGARSDVTTAALSKVDDYDIAPAPQTTPTAQSRRASGSSAKYAVRGEGRVPAETTKTCALL